MLEDISIVSQSSLFCLFFVTYVSRMTIFNTILDLQLPVQSVPITIKVVSSNPAHGELYSIKHYVIKFESDLRQVGGFLQVLRFPPPIKQIATI